MFCVWRKIQVIDSSATDGSCEKLHLQRGDPKDSQHRNASKRHGGVGLFIKDSLYMSYNIHVVDKSFDGLLGVLFEHKSLKYNFVVFCCHLPPEDSPWGEMALAFLVIY